MLEAEILYPHNACSETKCVECNLAYSKKEYEVLYNAFKIKYFYLSSTTQPKEDNDLDIIICHSCLFSIIEDVAEESKNDVVPFRILTQIQEIQLEFDLQLGQQLHEGTNMDDFLEGIDQLDADWEDDGEKNDIFGDDPRDTDDTREDDTDDLDWE